MSWQPVPDINVAADKSVQTAVNRQVLLQLYKWSIAESRSDDDDTSQWEYSLILSA